MSVQCSCSSLLFENRSRKATNNNSNQKCSRIFFPSITMLCHKSKLKWIFLCLNFDLFCCLNQEIGTTNLVGWTKKEDKKTRPNQNKTKKKSENKIKDCIYLSIIIDSSDLFKLNVCIISFLLC